MSKLNLLGEALISNLTVASGQRPLSTSEVDYLITGNGSPISVSSGTTMSISIDFGHQKAIADFVYSFSPVSLSGLSITYGRDHDDLTVGTASIVDGYVKVVPSSPDYTFPRFFQITHTAAENLVISGLSIYNTEDDIDFGPDGTQDSITISTNQLDGYSDVQEIKVWNRGSIPADIFVSVDSVGEDQDVVSRLELSPTSSGEFRVVESGLAIPESIPWEWGTFSGTTVTDEGQLSISNTGLALRSAEIGSELFISKVAPANKLGRATKARMADGYDCVVYPDPTSLVFVDCLRDISYNSSSISGGVTTGTGVAWDGSDRVYYVTASAPNNIYYYEISTNTHHLFKTIATFTWVSASVRAVSYQAGFLYIIYAGSFTGSGSINRFLRVGITTQQELQLPDPPVVLTSYDWCGGKLYIGESNAGGLLYVYNPSLNTWGTLPQFQGVTFLSSVLGNERKGTIWYIYSDQVWEYSPVTSTWSAIYSNVNSASTGNAYALVNDYSLLYSQAYNGSTPTCRALAVDVVTVPPLQTTFSGTWLSPVFKLDDQKKNLKLLFDYIASSGSGFWSDDSVGVYNLEFRGSDSSPAGDNLVEEFDDELDVDGFQVSQLSNYSGILSQDKKLTFDHTYIDANVTPKNSAYVMSSLPFSCSGKMQYRFRWNPSSSKTSSSHISAFYIVPYLDLTTGQKASRDSATLKRTGGEYFYVALGKDTDTASYTALRFYNGVSETSYTIAAYTGSFYEITLHLDWDAATYELWFEGSKLGQGNVPLPSISAIGSYHSFEFFSAAVGVTTREQFSHFTTNRMGLIPTASAPAAIPLHQKDPLFGAEGSLPWFPVTINNALFPKYDYVQLRLKLRSPGVVGTPKLNSITFPVVIQLADVQPGESGSLYIRYNFPSRNKLTTNTLKLKAWMATDKT